MEKYKNKWWLSLAILFLVIAGINRLLLIGTDSTAEDKSKLFEEVDKERESWCVADNCFKKVEGEWSWDNELEVEELNRELVDIYWQKIKEMERGELVSENMEKLEEYGLGEENRVSLRVGELKLYLGKISSDYEGTYLMMPKGDKVYKSQIILESRDLKNKEYWTVKE